jgi:LacI family transcriptional regulator
MLSLLETGQPDSGCSQRFTAVFAASDMMALGCLHTLRECGIRVPQDLSLVGFDDIPVAEYLHPPLTSIALRMRELGVSGMNRLQSLLIDADRGQRVRVHPTALRIRASTGPVRAGGALEVSA